MRNRFLMSVFFFFQSYSSSLKEVISVASFENYGRVRNLLTSSSKRLKRGYRYLDLLVSATAAGCREYCIFFCLRWL